MQKVPDLHTRLDRVMRQDRGRLMSALVRVLGDFELAEDALSDALESALTHWDRSGIPTNPIGWLLRVARRKAIDRIRRNTRFRDRIPDISQLAKMDEMDANEPRPEIEDERLRLIFTCCHPALEAKTRVALTLRTLCGLSTAEVARAYLDRETTMGQRLSRARTKISRAGIAYEVPGSEHWDARLSSVLTVVYLIFNEGYSSINDATPKRADLCEEAIFLARLLSVLKPDEPEIEGLLALLLITHCRRAGRVDVHGQMVPLSVQDTEKWNTDLAEEGNSILARAITRKKPGAFQIKAAISALHIKQNTDWQQIVLLYDSLLRFEPSPVVYLNRAVAIAENGDLTRALDELRALAEVLTDYQPFYAAFGEYLLRAGEHTDAISAFGRAIEMAGNEADREYLIARRASVLQ